MIYYFDKNYYFITCRTILRKNYFFDNDRKQIILDQLREVENKFGIKFIFFAILSNHYHLLFYLETGYDLKKIMQHINGGSSFKLNKLDKESRSIWDEYHNENIHSDKSYYKVMGYILGNPFKHDLVKSIDELKDYPFVNYNEAVESYGKETVDEIICDVKNLNWDIK